MNQVDKPFLIWPQVGPENALQLLLALVVIAIPLIIAGIYVKHYLANAQRWILISSFATKRALDLAETNLLKVFFDHLSSSEKERIIHDRGHFRSSLFAFLHNHPGDARREIRLIDKLFPDMKHWHEVLSPSDLQPGEACALEIAKHQLLGIVLSIDNDFMTVSLRRDSAPPEKGQKVGVYVYRPQIGGFVLEAEVTQSWPGGVQLRHTGEIANQGELHLMTRLQAPIKLKPWSDPTAHRSESTSQAGPRGAPPGDLPAENNEGQEPTLESDVGSGSEQVDKGQALAIEEIVGTIDRISDRGLVFRSRNMPPNGPPPGVWQMEAVIADGFLLDCRGKVMRAGHAQDRFLFRFLDLSDNARHVIHSEIKRLGGEREQLV